MTLLVNEGPVVLNRQGEQFPKELDVSNGKGHGFSEHTRVNKLIP